MGSRGRTSNAALTLVQGGQVSAVHRPVPPNELTPEQADEWTAIVDRMPADWFRREHWPLLTAFCRHVVTHRRVENLIQREEGGKRFDVERYDRLLKMRDRESRAIASLATKMRLTHQSGIDRKKPRGAAAAKPWDE